MYGEPRRLRPDVNVPLFTRLEGCIECTQRDGHPIFTAFLPEKLRSTLAAEGASSCWGGPVFSQQVCASEQPQVTLRDTAVCCKRQLPRCGGSVICPPGSKLIEPLTGPNRPATSYHLDQLVAPYRRPAGLAADGS